MHLRSYLVRFLTALPFFQIFLDPQSGFSPVHCTPPLGGVTDRHSVRRTERLRKTVEREKQGEKRKATKKIRGQKRW